MEDYAVYLAEEARSDIATLHQFKILYNPKGEEYHFFFEGEEDSLFFMPESRQYINSNQTNIYDCGGKKNVVEVRDSIKSDGYDIDKCLFFIDRDFDDFLGTQATVDTHTYITDGYSIENDISTLEGVKIILMDILRISRADPCFQKIENDLENGFQLFYNEIRPLIAWILAAKNLGCAPNLRNTAGLKNIVTISSAKPKITKTGFSEFKKKVVVNGRLPSMQETLKWRRQLEIKSAKLWVRGKYEIWFFQTALLSSINEANLQRKAVGGRAIRIPSSLRDGNIFEILGGRLSSPLSLKTFLQSKLKGKKQ
jgi:hypothetical protein